MSAPDYVIYTDGSFRMPGDHTPAVVSKVTFGSWSAILLKDDVIINQLTGCEWNTSINRMELTAIIKAVADLPAGSVINIYSDSKYCVNSINVWITMWERSNWITAGTGQPVLNRDLMEQIYALKSRHNIFAYHVKGHSGDKYNEMADQLAQSLTIQMAAGKLLPTGMTLQSPPMEGPIKIERPPPQHTFNKYAQQNNRFRRSMTAGKSGGTFPKGKPQSRPF